MNISQKTILSFTVSTILLVAMVGVAIFYMIVSDYQQMGRKNHQDNHERSITLIDNDFTAMVTSRLDWSVWDDTYYYISQPQTRKAYEGSNLNAESMTNLHLDLMSIWDSRNNLLMLRYDPKQKEDFESISKQAFTQIIAPYQKTLFPKNELEIVSGLIETPTGYLFVSSQPIRKSDLTGKPNGRMIFGKFINAEFSKKISHLGHVPISFTFKNQLHNAEHIHAQIPRSKEQSANKVNNSLTPKFSTGKSGAHSSTRKQSGNIILNGKQYVIQEENHYHIKTSELELTKNHYMQSPFVENHVDLLVTQDYLLSRSTFVDINKKPIFEAISYEPRTLFLNALHKMELFYIGFILLTLLSGGVNLFIIHHWIISKIQKLKNQLTQVTENNPIPVVNIEHAEDSPDEVDELISNVKMMLTHIRDNEKTIIESRNQAEQANIAKGNFLANMSHEIRTPLHSMMGALDLIGTTETNKEQNRYLEVAQISGKTLLEILGDILDFSKIESGQIVLNESPFSVANLVDEVVIVKKDKIEETGLKFILENNITLKDEVLGDFTRLKQVLLNLISNARKYTKEGEITFKVNAFKANEKEAHLFFEIKDTGIGIAKEKLGRIFERFYQVDNSSQKRVFSGVGLGLSISQGIIEKMGGMIQVDSRQGQGSTFWFSLKLPIQQATFCPLNYEQSLSMKQATPFNTLAPSCNILIVDDQALNRTIMEKFIKKLGMEASLAKGGQEACDMCLKTQYDLILMDIQMPELDGIEASRLIKWQAKGIQPIIVALTANTSSTDIKYYLDCGFNEFLGKPISLEHLQEAFAHWRNKYGLNLNCQIKAEPQPEAVETN